MVCTRGTTGPHSSGVSPRASRQSRSERIAGVSPLGKGEGLNDMGPLLGEGRVSPRRVRKVTFSAFR